MKEGKEHIPNELRDFRKSANYDQRDVAFLLDIKNVGRISEWEQGLSNPGLENLIKLEIIYQRLTSDMYFELRRKLAKEIEERKKLLDTMKRKGQMLDMGG